MKKEKQKLFKPEMLLEPFKPANILHAIKNPDEVLINSLKSLTQITGSITGINFNFYSQVRSEAKQKTELTFIGQKKLEEVKIQLFRYNENECTETEQRDDYQDIQTEDPQT